MKSVKILFTVVILLGYSGVVHGQSEKKNYLGVHYSFGACDYTTGGAVINSSFISKKFQGESFKSLGFDYARRTSENIDFCVGITFTVNNMVATTSGWSGGFSTTSTLPDNFPMFTLPVHLKYHFLKYLFIDGGIYLNIHPSWGYKWGAGAGAGAGFEYEFDSGVSVSLCPFLQWHLLNLGSYGESMGGMDRIFQKGISIGAGYRF